MNSVKITLAIGIMAFVSYLPRVIPLAVFRKRIQNQFVQSFLIYMHYGILAAMVFPEIFYSTEALISGILGAITALILAYKRLSLLPVALGATAVVFITERMLVLFQ